MKNEQKFYSALENIFIGEAGQKIEGKSGYVNLMKLKSQYFAHIKPFIEKEVNITFGQDTAAREEAFQKLFTFFESYLNETGTPYFSQTPFYKNLYEKVYSEREDVSLFWKTKQLYYVKSEANYYSLQNIEVDRLNFNFDASQIEHQKNNEKKSLEFWATQLTSDSITFKVVYEDNSKSKWERLKEYLKLDKPEEIRKYLSDNFGNKDNPNIIYKDNGLIRDGLKAKQLQSALLITNNADLIKSVTVEFALSNLDDLEVWAKHNKFPNLTEREVTIKKAQQLYKKQNEVDYFIHKDAESFLKEQLDMFLYQYLFGDRHIGNEWTQVRIDTIQKLKRIALKIINYIARFEDELKHIWEKKKIVKQVNYVFTLDKMEKRIDLIEKIISHKNFAEQIKEWTEIGINGTINPEKIIEKKKEIKSISDKHKFLPIDTKFFPDLKYEILSSMTNVDELLNGILIKSDNFHGLNSISKKYQSQIQTLFIDPPFNLESNGDFDYKVNYKDSAWLTILENRLSIAKDLLHKRSGSFIRCDYNGNMFVRLLLNKLYGANNFKSEIILNRFKKESDTFTNTTESLFYFTISEDFVFKKIPKKRDCVYCKQPIEPKWQWAHSAGKSLLPRYFEVNGEKVLLYPPRGRHWTNEQTKINQLTEAGRIRIDFTTSYIDSNDKKINFIPEKLQDSFINVDNNWTDIPGYEFGVFTAEKFSTQNSDEVLKRVIEASSIADDWVLDFFLGSGTTVAVAHKMGRKWIGIEMGEHFYTKVLPRMKRAIAFDAAGISRDEDIKLNYNKNNAGGFFKYYELEQYEECLARASYNPKKLNKDGSINELEQLAYYTFSNSEKLLSAMLIDEEKEEVKVHFQTLYPEMDEAAIAETISNISGKRIKTLSKEKVVFEDGSKIEFSKMHYDDIVFRDHYKALLWWKSKE